MRNIDVIDEIRKKKENEIRDSEVAWENSWEKQAKASEEFNELNARLRAIVVACKKKKWKLEKDYGQEQVRIEIYNARDSARPKSFADRKKRLQDAMDTLRFTIALESNKGEVRKLIEQFMKKKF